LLAINTYIAGNNSSKVLNKTIKANDHWSFYQAKSIKQTLAELREDAEYRKESEKAQNYKLK